MKRTRRLLPLAATLAVAAIGLSSCGGTEEDGAKPAAATAPVATKTAFTIHADTVLGTKNLADADKATKACVLQSRYARNSQVVWRARVLDGADGSQMDDSKLESVTVTLADGQTFPMKFAPHPKTDPTDAFWAVSWTVPAEYPTGTVNFTVSANVKGGATAVFEPFNVAPSLLIITDEVVPTIEAA